MVLQPQNHCATYRVIVTVNFDLREGTGSRDSSPSISFHWFFASSNIQSHWRERMRTKTIASIKNPEALYVRFDSFIHLFAFLTSLSGRRNTRCSRVRILRTYACRVYADYKIVTQETFVFFAYNKYIMLFIRPSLLLYCWNPYTLDIEIRSFSILFLLFYFSSFLLLSRYLGFFSGNIVALDFT